MTEYRPELGQMCFGQPFKQFACSELVNAALSHIREELNRVMWNIQQKEYHSPFDNSGNVEGFKCRTFEAHAYSWGDDEQPFNFKWRDVEISWYKYLGRGMSANREIKPDQIHEMLDECIAACRKYEEQNERP